MKSTQLMWCYVLYLHSQTLKEWNCGLSINFPFYCAWVISHWCLESRHILICFSVRCGTHKEQCFSSAKLDSISMLLYTILTSPHVLDNSLLQYMVFLSMFPIASCPSQIPSAFSLISSFSTAICVLICHSVCLDTTGKLTFLPFFQLVP